MPAAGVHHGPQHVEGGAEVVLEVLARVLHRFADVAAGGEVDHRVGAQGVEQGFHRRPVPQVQHVERDAGHRLGVARGQVVHDPDVLAARAQQPDGVAADVAGAAGDQDAHRAPPLSDRRSRK